MSIELPKQPHDGRPRHCYKCRVSFMPCAEYRNARQCPNCRANPLKAHNPHVLPKQPRAGHTHTWDSRSLGLVEAAALRMVWGGSTTENSE